MNSREFIQQIQELDPGGTAIIIVPQHCFGEAMDNRPDLLLTKCEFEGQPAISITDEPLPQ